MENIFLYLYLIDLSELPAFLTKEAGLNSGFMIAHCTAAALGESVPSYLFISFFVVVNELKVYLLNLCFRMNLLMLINGNCAQERFYTYSLSSVSND